MGPLYSDVGSGSAYDKLSALKSDYNALNRQYSSLKTNVDASGIQYKNCIHNAQLELDKAKAEIEDAESALASGKSKEEVQNRINRHKSSLMWPKLV